MQWPDVSASSVVLALLAALIVASLLGRTRLLQPEQLDALQAQLPGPESRLLRLLRRMSGRPLTPPPTAVDREP